MLRIIKWTAMVNLDVNGIQLHRELDFIRESEIDKFIAESTEPYEKIPVWGEIKDFGEAPEEPEFYEEPIPAEYH